MRIFNFGIKIDILLQVFSLVFWIFIFVLCEKVSDGLIIDTE